MNTAKNKKIIRYSVYALIILSLTLLLTAVFVYLSLPQVRRSNQPVVLTGTEVREYQGKNLSSINDFEENSIKSPQYVDVNNYKLKIDGTVVAPAEYAYDEVINKFKHYQKVVTLNCVEGWSVSILWEGVLLKDLLAAVKPTADAKVVIFHSADGYTTSLPLVYFMANDIIMAYKMNDVVIPPERGFPFMLVAENKWGFKWAKWITEIEVSADANYRGYWESRGYGNDADLNKNFLGF